VKSMRSSPSYWTRVAGRKILADAFKLLSKAFASIQIPVLCVACVLFRVGAASNSDCGGNLHLCHCHGGTMASRTLGYPTKTAEQVGRTSAAVKQQALTAHCLPPHIPGQASESCPSHNTSSNATHADRWRGALNLTKNMGNMNSKHRLSIRS